MRKVKEILRLKHASGLSKRQIARSCNVSRSTVADYLMRARGAGVNWPEAAELTETQLEGRLFPTEHLSSSVYRPPPDCDYIYNQLRRYRSVNLTLIQLWLEYKEKHPDGYQYTQFCEHYHRWRGKLDYCMRQEHRAGEKVFIDYSDGLSIVDPLTGELIPTQLFVAVWGASNYTYAEATLSQTLPHWIGSHVRAFHYFGSIPRAVVPDNLKSGVNKACFYDPEMNPTYAEMAEHYGCAVLPARPRRPRDKAKAEVGVLIAQRWILAVLRQRTFYSLAELNAAIRECLECLNTRPMRRMGKSRRELFESLDRPCALPLPEHPYEYAEWLKARVNIDYHIEVDHHYYSVPFQLLREKLDVRLTPTTIEAFRKGERVAAHIRSYVRGKHTTLREHMPPEHRRYAEWSPSRFIQWAAKTGAATAQLVEKIMAARIYPEQGYRACLGIIRLGQHYEPERVEAAAQRALKFNTCSYKSVRAILAAGLDRQPDAEEQPHQMRLLMHGNIRGREYYATDQEENYA
ncbi:MAG: IS21 family transposase [Dehalococcoidia bacterium]|jgi:transposase|nr:IS21 family transposase [Dehalococcoidia bacterium]MDP6783026.1 IS21 family transposase [Dehalococcoidia bacterium]